MQQVRAKPTYPEAWQWSCHEGQAMKDAKLVALAEGQWIRSSVPLLIGME